MILRDYQIDAIRRMKNGCILCGGVGSGKSRTSIAYYYIQMGGKIYEDEMVPMQQPRDLYIITTARKRDTKEWEYELDPFLIKYDNDIPSEEEPKGPNVVIDSWNNIGKYADVENAFFIFDEQRLVSYGAWTKSFLRIAKSNLWILLSATPGDKVEDYMPVMIANGFYKNKTDFVKSHIVYDYRSTFPKVDRYLELDRFNRLRRNILVQMDFDRETVSHHIDINCNYDKQKYKDITKNRWDPFKDEPIENASSFCYTLRRLINSSDDRMVQLLELIDKIDRVIIFYNFDYELEAMKTALQFEPHTIAEWNGHKHQPIPETDKWIYLVQYTAGAEGWNCTKTDSMIFFSQNYSYKIMVQSSGRIDRLNTPYKDLYYYHLKSTAPIDLAIARALKQKKNFNEGRFASL